MFEENYLGLENECIPHALICKQSFQSNRIYGDADELLNEVYLYLKNNCKAYDKALYEQIRILKELEDMVSDDTYDKIEENVFQLSLYLDMLRFFHMAVGKQIAAWNFHNIKVDKAKLCSCQGRYQNFLLSPQVQKQRKKALNEQLVIYRLLTGNQEAIRHWYKSVNIKYAIYESMHNYCVITGYEAETLWFMYSGTPPNDTLTDLVQQEFDKFYLPYDETKNTEFVTDLIALCEKQ